MSPLRHNLCQRLQHKLPLGNTRMGQRQSLTLDNKVVVEEYIYINAPRGISRPRSTLYFLLCRTVTPQTAFDIIHRLQYPHRLQVALDNKHLIAKILSLEAPSLGTVDPRVADHSPHLGINQLRSLTEPSLGIAHISTRYQNHSCHIVTASGQYTYLPPAQSA